MKAKIRDTELYFDVAGMGLVPHQDGMLERTPVFLLHGGPGSDHSSFKAHSLDLAQVAQLIFIDQRGCGRSAPADISTYTLDNNVADLEALRVHLGFDKIILLGVSYGGMLAQRYAIDYPQHCEKLILVSTAPSYRFLDDAKQNVQQRGSAEQIKACEDLWQGSFRSNEHFKQYFDITRSLYSTAPKLETNANILKRSRLSYQVLNQAFGGFLRDFDVIDDLATIVCPTLVLAGEQDWICPPQHSRLIAERIAQAELHVFANAGHALTVDAHKHYIDKVKQFLINSSSEFKTS